MEAALVRVPTLAARTDAFQYAIRDGENGFLSSNPEEWTAKLTHLRQADLRENMAKQAHIDAHMNYDPRVRARQAVAVLNEATAALGRPFHWEYQLNESGESTAYDWAPSLERKPGSIEMGIYTLRNRGFRTLVGQIWVFFRRWLARYIPYGLAKK